MNPVQFQANANTVVNFEEDWKVHNWTVNGRKISLIKRQDRLMDGVDSPDGSYVEHDIHLPIGLKVNRQVVRYLLDNKTVLEDNGFVTLIEPTIQQVLDGKEICLLMGLHNLVWQVFDKTLNESVQVSFEHTIFSYRCSEATRNRITAEKTKSLVEQAEFFRDFTILNKHDYNNITKTICYKKAMEKTIIIDYEKAKIDLKKPLKISALACVVTFSILGTGFFGRGILPSSVAFMSSLAGYHILQEPGNRFAQLEKALVRLKSEEKELQKNKEALELFNNPDTFTIEIEPISAHSKIDDRVLVSKFMWAVTLICREGSDGNHAQIMVEGINNGEFDGLPSDTVDKYFIHMSDFFGQSIVRSEIIKVNLPYDQRTKIWKVPCEKAIKMLDNIRKKMKKIDDGEEIIEFSMYGPSYFYPNAENCFTLAKEQLKEADIVDLGTQTLWGLGIFPNRTKNYTEYGNSIYLGLGVPVAPVVWLNNISDENNFSESSIKYRESL